MEGAIGVSGEIASIGSLFDTLSGESRQAEILSGSGGHVVRAAIAAAIELLLGVGIANQGKRGRDIESKQDTPEQNCEKNREQGGWII